MGSLFRILLVAAPVCGSPLVVAPSYRSPASCERNACVPSATYCSERIPGVYKFLGPACASGMTCTACVSNSTSGVITCTCEQPPYIVSALYGESCSSLNECSDGSCFRPCDTFLYASYCPTDRCVWDYTTGSCGTIQSVPSPIAWTTLAPFGALRPPELLRGEFIVNGTQSYVFPITLESLSVATTGYYLQGVVRLVNYVSIEDLFLLLDGDSNGSISMVEFSILPSILQSLWSSYSASVVDPASHSMGSLLLSKSEAPLVMEAGIIIPTTGTISSTDPGANCGLSSSYYCELSDSCVSTDCSTDCGWKSTEDPLTGYCVAPSAIACRLTQKFYCPTKNTCVSFDNGCEKNCSLGSVPDLSSYLCREQWWLTPFTPSEDPSSWICGNRKSADQTCRSDRDCVFGKKECGPSGTCLPVDAECVYDEDCPNLGYFCGGSSPLQCTPQLGEGAPCETHSQCNSFLRCNFAEQDGPPVCRALFSRPVGSAVSDSSLCDSGVVNADNICADPFVSKTLGQSCVDDQDCPTSDPSGTLGTCSCLTWWDSGSLSCKTCRSTSGDLANGGESLRNYYYLKSTYCGNLWTDEECVAETVALGNYSVQIAYLSYRCEVQTLDGSVQGQKTLDPNAGCGDLGAIDFCTELLYAQVNR